MSDEHRIDEAITEYREQLAREADVGRAQLDEIEDHMRSLIDDLRATGMPLTIAVTEAARRLGDPAAVARESARVRTAFGAKLPAWRAWLAVAMTVPQIVMLALGLNPDFIEQHVLELGLAGMLAIALAWRLTWARAVMFGVMTYSVVFAILTGALLDLGPPTAIVALQAGAAALLAPWRRHEITAPGVALALLYPIFVATSWLMLGGAVSSATPDPRFLMLATLMTGAGIVLRARWATFTALASAVLLAAWTYWLAGVSWNVPDATPARALYLGLMIAGLAAALATAVIAWRSARSKLGSLRGVLA